MPSVTIKKQGDRFDLEIWYLNSEIGLEVSKCKSTALMISITSMTES